MVSETDTMVEFPFLGEITYREWHALINGVYCGYQGIDEHPYKRERHYWRLGISSVTASSQTTRRHKLTHG